MELRGLFSGICAELRAFRSPHLWIVIVGLLFFTEQRAYAYVDPGTGSFLWQILVAGIVGLLFYLRKAVSFLKIRRKVDKS